MVARRTVSIADNQLLDVHIKKGDKSVGANVYLEYQSLTFMAPAHSPTTHVTHTHPTRQC